MSGSFKITVAPNGATFKIDVDGVVGTKCTDITKVFELGAIVEAKKKPEYFVEAEDAITVNGAG